MQRAAPARREAVCLAEGTGGDGDLEVPQIQSLVETQRVDGIVLWPSPQTSAISPGAAYLYEERIPCVLVPEPDTEVCADFHSVGNADSGAAGGIMQHLLELGHQAIAFARQDGDEQVGYAERRFRHYEAAMGEAGLSALPPLDLSAMASFEGAAKAVSKRLSTLTAVFCATDRCALSLLEYCLHEGIRVPYDVSVVGYDNTALAAAMGLTSVEQNFAALGETAVALLLDEIEGRCPAPVHQTVASEIVYRRSTGPPTRRGG